MASKAIKFLEEHQSETPSRFAEEATWRKENASWLRRSHRREPTILEQVLAGTENLGFKSIANIEDKLGRICVAMI